MKLRNLAVLGLVTLSLTTLPALAQVSTFRVNIPFSFVVGNQTLPAATYVVQRYLGKPKNAGDTGVIVLKASDHHVYKVIVTAASGNRHQGHPQGSRLVFSSFQGRQYLNCIWVAGDAAAYQLATAADDIAPPNETSEVVVTALNGSSRK